MVTSLQLQGNILDTYFHILKTSETNILAISGSLRSASSNQAIINTLMGMVPNGVTISLYADMAGLPHYNPELDTDDPPEVVTNLRKQLQQADGILICTPEYAFGVPGSLKNLLDWTVSSGEFVNKPVALITASSVGEHAHASLQLTLDALSANIPNDAKLLIPFVRTKINSSGLVTDVVVLASLRKVVYELLRAINI